jgi:3-methyl-2-oxobutanoate hydroxymethyltransferase
MKPITLSTLRKMKQQKEKIACLTAYDATFARTMEQAGVEVLLVGDSLGMVVQGRDSTLPVTLDEMIYHTQVVGRGSQNAFIITDMPFLSYKSPSEALDNAGRVMQKASAHMVKLEGGAEICDAVSQLSKYAIPVCAHLGLQPQSVYKLGGYKVQGREDNAAAKIIEDAKALQDAGAELLVLECMPADLAAKLTDLLHIPTIGIGAGPHCDGQVLVMHDALGLSSGVKPRFVKDFMQGRDSISDAFARYVAEVKDGAYPAPEHCF